MLGLIMAPSRHCMRVSPQESENSLHADKHKAPHLGQNKAAAAGTVATARSGMKVCITSVSCVPPPPMPPRMPCVLNTTRDANMLC